MWALAIVILLVLHKLVWEPRYSANYDKENFKNEKVFKSQKWKNQECDQAFELMKADGKVFKLIEYELERKDFSRKVTEFQDVLMENKI